MERTGAIQLQPRVSSESSGKAIKHRVLCLSVIPISLPLAVVYAERLQLMGHIMRIQIGAWLVAITILAAAMAGPASADHCKGKHRDDPGCSGSGGGDTTLGSLTATCSPGDNIARFDGTNWVCGVDETLDQTGVEALGFVTGGHTVDTDTDTLGNLFCDDGDFAQYNIDADIWECAKPGIDPERQCPCDFSLQTLFTFLADNHPLTYYFVNNECGIADDDMGADWDMYQVRATAQGDIGANNQSFTQRVQNAAPGDPTITCSSDSPVHSVSGISRSQAMACAAEIAQNAPTFGIGTGECGPPPNFMIDP